MNHEERVLTRFSIDDRQGKTGCIDRKVRTFKKRLAGILKSDLL